MATPTQPVQPQRNWRRLAVDIAERTLRSLLVVTGGSVAIGTTSWHVVLMDLIAASATVLLGVGGSYSGGDPNTGSFLK